MIEIKCLHDLNKFILGKPAFENPFPEEEYKQKRFYGDCFHCFATAIASRDHQLKSTINKNRKVGVRMNIDWAIKHCEEVAQEKRDEYQECLAMHDTENAISCEECGKEHEQLAKWLKELKSFREKETVSKESYDHEYFLRKELEMEVEKLKRQLLEQEPKTGHWIFVEKTNAYTKYRCSKCGTLFKTSKTPWYKYCPNCGVENIEIK